MKQKFCKKLFYTRYAMSYIYANGNQSSAKNFVMLKLSTLAIEYIMSLSGRLFDIDIC